MIGKENIDFENLLDNLDWESNRLIKINSNFALTKYQIDILTKFNIDYQSSGSINNLIYLISDVLTEVEDEELELILEELAKRNYYENTNK